MESDFASQNDSIPTHIDNLHSERLRAIENRDDLPADIPDGAAVILHAIPTNIGTQFYRTEPSDLPIPPVFGISRRPTEEGTSSLVEGGKVETDVLPEMEIAPSAYSFVSEEGWFEAVTTSFHSFSVIDSMLDDNLIVTLQGGLDCLEYLGAELPVYVYLTLIDVEDYRFEPAAEGYGYAPERLPKHCTPEPTLVTSYIDRPDAILNLMSEL
jgi:hypothetical protein